MTTETPSPLVAIDVEPIRGGPVDPDAFPRVDPDEVAALHAPKGGGTAITLKGGAVIHVPWASPAQVEALLWRPEFVQPPGIGRNLIVGPVIDRGPGSEWPPDPRPAVPHVRRVHPPGTPGPRETCEGCSFELGVPISWDRAASTSHRPQLTPTERDRLARPTGE